MKEETLPRLNSDGEIKISGLFIEGYANTKNQPDRYGDVPSAYLQKRGHVYDYSQFLKNPVLLIDHVNQVDRIAGSVVAIKEDERGLYFKAELSKSDYPLVKHVRKLYEEGHARGISIAGKFHYENPENPNQLTLAEIYEISLVAVPADPSALAVVGKAAGEKIPADEQAAKAEIENWAKELRESRIVKEILSVCKMPSEKISGGKK